MFVWSHLRGNVHCQMAKEHQRDPLILSRCVHRQPNQATSTWWPISSFCFTHWICKSNSFILVRFSTWILNYCSVLQDTSPSSSRFEYAAWLFGKPNFRSAFQRVHLFLESSQCSTSVGHPCRSCRSIRSRSGQVTERESMHFGIGVQWSNWSNIT